MWRAYLCALIISIGCATVRAQTDTGNEVGRGAIDITPNTVVVNPDGYVDTLDGEPIYLISIHTLEHYEQERWNDSCLADPHEWVNQCLGKEYRFDSTNVTAIVDSFWTVRDCPYVWKHREPTWSGFVRYIKRGIVHD